MKKIILIAMICVLWAASPALADDVFPDLKLTGDLTPEHTAYLGAGDTPFNVSSIASDYVFVELFSMYCPICQRDEPIVHDIFTKVSAADTDNRIRFIGIGAGNTPFEVAFYAKKFHVAFPLFHDENFVAHKALHSVGTPSFYLVDVKNGLKLLFFQEGEIKNADADAMVKLILDAIKK